jgi:hypothetical protein
MTFAKLDLKSKSQLLRHLAAAIRSDDREEFCTQTQMGVAFFDQQTVADIINRELPLVLDTKYIPRLLQFMVGEDAYVDTVRSFLAELSQVMSTNGFIVGTDFSYGESDGIPYIAMTEDTALKVENIYEPHAWKQCAPYLNIQ